MPEPGDIPLCVDLDGTLVRTDTLHEMLVGATRDWRTSVRLPHLLIGRRSRLKSVLAETHMPAIEHLPYNDPLLDWLRQQREAGRRIVLATAAPERVARAVSEYIGLFDDVLSSSATSNLRGSAKAEALVERYGEKGFDYAGNDMTDVLVWQRARRAVIVSASPAVRARAAAVTEIERVFPVEGSRLRHLVRALRPHQWSKNVLVFVPVVTAKAVLDGASLMAALVTFLAFSAAASGIYVLNDLTDLSADRQHPRKRKRPFASGALPIAAGLVMAPLLIAAGISVGAVAGVAELIILYAALSITYSLRLKEYPLVDIFTLAALYTLRLYAGGEASGHRVSLWLLAFSCFLFLGLAAMKRVSELIALRERNHLGTSRRDYGEADLPILMGFGCASAFVASLVLALYVQATFSSSTEPRSLLLWTIVPLTLFWQCRMWLATARGYMQDDPIVYAAHDWVSRLVALALFAIFSIAAVAHVLPGGR